MLLLELLRDMLLLLLQLRVIVRCQLGKLVLLLSNGRGNHSICLLGGLPSTCHNLVQCSSELGLSKLRGCLMCLMLLEVKLLMLLLLLQLQLKLLLLRLLLL